MMAPIVTLRQADFAIVISPELQIILSNALVCYPTRYKANNIGNELELDHLGSI